MYREGICVHSLDDTACDNGQYCDGVETCDATNGCLNGTAPSTDDGVGCTVDTCDEANDQIVHTPNHDVCLNNLFCDGQETCDSTVGCVDGTPPTTNDNVGCTIDACDEANDKVVHTPNDGACDNTLFCDGKETCHATEDCQDGKAPNPDDGIDCTIDTCSEVEGRVLHTPSDERCDDALFCNGAERCDGEEDCQPGEAPALDLLTPFTLSNTPSGMPVPAQPLCATTRGLKPRS